MAISRHIAQQKLEIIAGQIAITKPQITNQTLIQIVKFNQALIKLKSNFENAAVNNCQQPHLKPLHLFAKAVFCE